MVQILGTGVSIDDLKWLGVLLFVALIFINVLANPTMSFFTILDEKVFGYPKCTGLLGVVCIAPSQVDINNAGNSFKIFSPSYNWTDIGTINAIVSLGSAVWVLLKAVLCIMVLWIPVSYVQRWYGFWFNTFPIY